jgi:hypothetical protein
MPDMMRVALESRMGKKAIQQQAKHAVGLTPGVKAEHDRCNIGTELGFTSDLLRKLDKRKLGDKFVQILLGAHS